MPAMPMRPESSLTELPVSEPFRGIGDTTGNHAFQRTPVLSCPVAPLLHQPGKHTGRIGPLGAVMVSGVPRFAN
jgi:hypothetical protein